MIYLLDVNALIALGFGGHVFHARVARWVSEQGREARFATTPITELGFVRVLAQIPAYGISAAQARALPGLLKESKLNPFVFIPDTLPIGRLPDWVTAPRQITDDHLAELAREHGAELATLDCGIKGAYLVPELAAS